MVRHSKWLLFRQVAPSWSITLLMLDKGEFSNVIGVVLNVAVIFQAPLKQSVKQDFQ